MSSNRRTGEPVVCVDQEISASLSHGLHQTTQPLTVLQGTLELALLNASTVEEYKQAVERSLEELQRVTDSFEDLRTLMQGVQQRKGEVSHV
jgi:signal transduction histidine kinase